MYNTTAYRLNDIFCLQGIRQFIKLCHIYSCLEKLTNPKILDVGCGYGEIIEFLRQNNFKCSYTALDVIDRIQNKNGITFIKFDLTSKEPFPFGLAEFDVVLLLDSLQNIDKKSGENVIMEVSRVIKPNGGVFISTRNSLLEPDTDATSHFYRWNVKELVKTLNNNSLELTNLYGINYGYDEKDVPRNNLLGNFFPSRLYRVIHGLNDWKKCKYVMMDCVKSE